MLSKFDTEFAALDALDRQIVQALGVFRRPVPAQAVAFTVRPFQPDLSTEAVTMRLNRLAERRPRAVFKEAEQYFLQPEDRARVLATFPHGEPSDAHEAGEPLFTRCTLLARAAEYYASGRKSPAEWQSLNDLQPQLAEFDLRCDLGDYEGAAHLIGQIAFEHLMRWGHYKLVIALRERLVDRLDEPALAQNNYGELGSAYAIQGAVQKAIEYQRKALDLARQMGDVENEGVWLANLGNRYASLGQTARAVDYYKLALKSARDTRNRRAEGVNLMALGTCAAQMGDFGSALGYYEAAHEIVRELGDLAAEGVCLSNMGNVYASFGNFTRATAAHDQSLEIARRLGNRVDEARRLGNLAEVLIANGQYGEAVESLLMGLAIDDEIGYQRGRNFKGISLACARLYQGDLAAARAAAELARRADTPQNNHNAALMLGICALRQGDSACAGYFQEALDFVERLSAQNARSFDALNAAALACCGLALRERDSTERLTQAQGYLSASRAITRAAGVVGHVRRLLAEIAKADDSRLLGEIQALAAKSEDE